MADRSVAVRLLAKVDGYVSGLKTAERATRDMVKNSRAEMETAGRALTALGLTTVGALGLATKSAIDWESAWAGVRKTVDGSDVELAAIEDGLRNLATTLPATHAEIAAVAEAAGQLGIQTDSIVDFTETMINLGETTNLSADEAATSIAQLMNIMQTAPDDVDNLGAALVELGNNGASTERDIIQMAQRIASSGQIVGLTEAEVLGFANALASVGIEADAGGSAISRVMQDMAKSVATGGEDLEQFAEVAGMSAQQFAAAFEADPAGAIASFIEGLGRMQDSGEDVFSVLDSLGQSDVRVSRALLSMAGSGDLLRESLDLGAQAWEENTALADEAAKRYDTTAAKMQIARNAINDAAITIGEQFLPLVADAAEAVADFSNWVGNLPPSMLALGSGMTAVAGGAALVGGGFLLLLPRALDTYDAFKRLNSISPGLTSRMGRFAAKASLVAAGFVAINAAGHKAQEAIYGTADGVNEVLRNLREGNYDETFSHLTGSYNSLGEALNTLKGSGAIEWLDRGLSAVNQATLGLPDDVQGARDAFAQMGDALATMVSSGDADSAAAQFDALAEKAAEYGFSQEDLLDLMPSYRDALIGLEDGAYDTAEATDVSTLAIEGNTAALEDNTAAAQEAAGQVLSLRDAQRNLEDAVDTASDSIEENGRTLDITTQAGRRNQAALDDVADSGWDLIDSMRANGASQEDLQDTMRDTRQRFIDAAESMGMSTQEAKDLADQLGLIPENVDADVTVNTEAAERAIDEFVNRSRHMYIQARVLSDPNYSPAHSSSQVARASGGPVTAKQGYWVGENGPEWFTPSTTGVITNAAASRSMYGADAMTSPAAPVVNVTTTAAENGRPGFHVDQIVAADPNAAVQAFAREVRYATMGA